MSIQPLDMKILWGKASGRCALCPKKEKVVIETPENKGKTDILFGEMCHIIGEKENAARGKSTMPVEDRDRYHNLILLCANHHTIIDKDEATYTVEKLHQIKADHEIWIDSRLDEVGFDEADGLYAKLVNAIIDDLQLNRLDSVSNGAICGRLPVWFVDAANQLLPLLFKTNWPGKRPDLEARLKNVESRLTEFLKIFHSNAEIDQSGHFFRRMKLYKNAPDGSPEHQKLLDEYNAWEKKSHRAFWNFVVSLNEMAESVRKDFNSRHFFFESKFCIVDEWGVTNGGVPIYYIPTSYQPLDG